MASDPSTPAAASAQDDFIPEEWPICCLGQARVTAANLRCRAEPATDGKILKMWPLGQVLDVWAKLRTGWWLVQERATGVTGWSSANLLGL
jgi:hypothetical protein